MTDKAKQQPVDGKTPHGGRARFLNLKRLLLTVATLMIALLAAEGVVRLFGVAPTLRAIDTSDPNCAYMRSENPILGYELKANYRNPKTDLLTSAQRTNRHGQRDVERTLEKPAGLRRVILLGDSVVESIEVRDIEKVMHRRLERMFPDNTVEVLNFGVNGYCTLSEVELLRVKGLAFKPDVVVVVFVNNDFNNFNLAMHAFASLRGRPPIANALFKRSHLFRSACVRFDLFGFAADENPVEWNANAIGENNVVTGLTMLKKLADREGFTPAIAIWPTFEEKGIFDGPTIANGDGPLLIEQLAAFHGIPSFRLSPYFDQDHTARAGAATPRTLYTIGDGMHASEEGSRVAALALKSLLATLDDPALAKPLHPSAAEYAGVLAKVRAMDQVRSGITALESYRADELLSAAKEMSAQGRLEDAVPLYTQAIAIDPDPPVSAHNDLGNALMALGRTREAIHHYRQAIKIKSDYAEAHNNLGHALQLLGTPADAIEHYREALRIDPGQAEAHYGWGLAMNALGNKQDAIKHFETALRLNPDHAAASNALRDIGNATPRESHQKDRP